MFISEDQERRRLNDECSGLRLAGQPVPAVDKARYLGLVHGPGHAFIACRETRCEAAWRAMYALTDTISRLRILSPDISMHCLEVLA